MRRLLTFSVPIGCVVALLLACYGSVLFRGEQFGYRDAAHFYYPLYKKVQAEWDAGRWPLWETEENSGMPLLGQPTAAVLYPGKILYAVLPYPWAVRLYTVGHTLLALLAMMVLLRSWGASWTASTIAGLSFAFGAPILFQYCNIIFLVGAAWIPFALRGADRWLRLGLRKGLLELAVALAMQTLGGDPQSAYVIGLCAGAYALGLAWHRGRSASSRVRIRRLVWASIPIAGLWIAVTLALAVWIPRIRPRGIPTPPLPWMLWVGPAVVAVWGVVGLLFLLRWKARHWLSPLGTMLAGLTGAAVLAGALASAQLLPVLEFTRQSSRASGQGPHDVYPFSLEPLRTVELFWPNIFGTSFDRNRAWLDALPPVGSHGKVWVPSLYLGALTVVLAIGAFSLRDGPPWRVWLSAVAAVSLLASFGEYTSPIYWARLDPSWVKLIGPHDDPLPTPIRLDGYLRDGDGGFYWFVNQVLPGFRQFRYPSKLLSFTAVALAALAGLGWDRIAARSSRRVAVASFGLLGLSLLGLAAVVLEQPRIVAYFSRSEVKQIGSTFGPLDAVGAARALRWALAHGAVLFAVGVGLALRAARNPRLTGLIALVVVAADLGVTNARLVLTVPQSVFDPSRTPKVVELIRRAEREKPFGGPFRIHRLPLWEPLGWREKPSANRVREFDEWERETIQPKYGLDYGVEYTMTLGTAELYDYQWFFSGFLRPASREAATALGIKEGKDVVVFTRRGFDFWNSRYFVLPYYGGHWDVENRGFASFLPRTQRIYPPLDAFDGPNSTQRQEEYIRRDDFQILRNLDAYPRAWVVHGARFLPPITGMSRQERNVPMMEILYQEDPFWTEPYRPIYNPRSMVWLEEDKRSEVNSFLTQGPAFPSETVTVTYKSPQKVELDVRLEQPGIVVLADVFYPGWKLTIDGQPAPIYRANRMMRGAAVRSGHHQLVYRYDPLSFRLGGWISIAGLLSLVLLGAVFARFPASLRLVPIMRGPDALDAGPQDATPGDEVAQESMMNDEPPTVSPAGSERPLSHQDGVIE